MVLTGETREMQENGTPAKQPLFLTALGNRGGFLLAHMHPAQNRVLFHSNNQALFGALFLVPDINVGNITGTQRGKMTCIHGRFKCEKCSAFKGIQLYSGSNIAEEVRRFSHLLKSPAGAGPAVPTDHAREPSV